MTSEPEHVRIPTRITAIVPVPLHRRRQIERGFNQSALLARHLAAFTSVSLHEDTLLRIRDTPPQVGKNYQERQENVVDSFQATRSLDGIDILLIDDVYTTGATLRACAHALRSAGARSVHALTLARPALAP